MITPQQICKTAFQQIAQHGWQRTTLPSIAEELQIAPEILRETLPEKEKIFQLLADIVLDQIQEALPITQLLPYSNREKVFELFLMKLEQLTPYKDGLCRLRAEVVDYPEAALSFLSAEYTRHQVLMKAYDLSVFTRKTKGNEAIPTPALSALHPFLDTIKPQALFLIYLATFFTWLQDITEGLEKTMAFLDQALGYGERFFNF